MLCLHRLCGDQFAHKAFHFRGSLRSELFDFFDDSRADDDRIGTLGPGSARLLRVADAEANGDGQLSDATDASEQFTRIGAELLARSGDAGDGDGVEKSGGGLRDLRDALLGGGGRDERDQIEAAALQGLRESVRCFGGKIGDQNSGKARIGGILRQAVETVAQQRIEIAEQDDGNAGGRGRAARDFNDVR